MQNSLLDKSMKPDKNTFISVAVILVVMICFFSPTIFSGKPVSRIGLLNEYDAIYNPSIKSSVLSFQYDPSLYHLQAPITYQLSQMRKTQAVPLWNPLNGCGYPMIGDPQSFLFSFIRFLFPTTNMHLYNLGIVLRICMTALGMFFLARSLGFIPAFSATIGLAYALCPWQLTYLELPFEFWLYPFVFWTFTRLGQEPTVRRAIWSGIATAIYVLTMHPECSFFSISLASLWCLILGLQNKQFLKCVMSLSICAGITFCLSAPMLLPFLEYYQHSDCYKTELHQMGALPFKWFTLFINLIFPVQSHDSPFLGIVVAVMLPFAVAAPLSRLAPVLTVLLTSFFIIAQLPPVSFLFQISPFNHLLPIYCLPVFLIMILLSSTLGMEALYTKYGRGNLVLFLIFSIIAVPLSRLTSLIGETRWAPLLAPLKFDFQEWLFCLLALIGLVLATLLYFFQRHRKNRQAVTYLILILNTVTLLKPAFAAMPVRAPFQFYNHPVIGCLQKNNKNGERMTATGLHTLLSNTNAIYGLSDLRMYNPFFPERYLDFFQAAGGKQYDLYLYCLQNPLNKLLDIANVRYIISRFPPFREEDRKLPMPELQNLKADLDISGIRLLKARLNYFPQRKAVLGILNWKVQEPVSALYSAQFILTDSKGKMLWESESLPLDSKRQDGHEQEMILALNVPDNISAGSTLKVKVQVGEKAVELFSFIKTAPALSQKDESFDILYEDNVNGMRLYQNKHVLPRAYIVHQVLQASSKEECLAILQSDNFEPDSKVVLERNMNGFSSNKNLVAKEPRVSDTKNGLKIEFESEDNGFLVVSSTFYPGWKASLNGKSAELLRANYLFSAAEVKKGKNQILLLEFKPDSFSLGTSLFIAAAIACAAGLLFLSLPLSNKSCK